MLVTRKSMISGITRTLDLPITMEQAAQYENGAMIQHAFPQLNASQREFILTGVTDAEWNSTFPEEDEEPSEDEAAF